MIIMSTGSSPLARGLLRRGEQHEILGRIIPARAGFTPSTSNARRFFWDHPRSRGVYDDSPVRARGAQGSSPLARGLRALQRVRPVNRRIIPARAGFTSSHEAEEDPGQDHPRSRGVYSSRSASRGASRGSSPLARGLPRTRDNAPQCRRIIPARAGFTARVTTSENPCGGSSPLARGLHRPG